MLGAQDKATGRFMCLVRPVLSRWSRDYKAESERVDEPNTMWIEFYKDLNILEGRNPHVTSSYLVLGLIPEFWKWYILIYSNYIAEGITQCILKVVRQNNIACAYHDSIWLSLWSSIWYALFTYWQFS